MIKIIVKHNKDKKSLTLFFVLLFMLMWIIMGFNTQNPDYEYYNNLFLRAKHGISYHAVETGFWFLINISVKLGIDYSMFIKIYTLIGLMLIGNSIVKYTKKSSLVLLLYMCYPFLLDVVQIRHFMAMAIFIFAMRYLEEYSKKNLLKYIACIVIAASQQIIALSFLVYILVYFTDQKKATALAVIFTIVNVICYRYALRTSLITRILSLRDKTIDYSGGYTVRQLLLYVCFYIFLILFCVFLKKINKKNDNNFFMYKICLYSTIFIPFLMIDFQYTRLFRGSIIVLYIFITRQISALRKENRVLFTIMLVFIMILVAMKLFGKGSGYYETITLPILAR